MGNLIGLKRGPRYIFGFTLSLLMLAGLSFPVWAAPKTDTIIFKNGDRLTGEIKSLERGRLSFNTAATGTIAIEWARIANIITNQYIQVETGSGTRYFGQLLATNEASSVLVDTEYGPKTLDNTEVILMSPIKTTSIRKAFDVEVLLGYNFAKAGGVKQGTFGIDAAHRTLERIYSIVAATTINDSNELEQSTRSNLEFGYRRLWQNRWYVAGNLNFDRNDELELDLRSSIGGSAGRYFIQTNNMLLDLQAGLQWSSETLTNDPEKVKSIEVLLTTHWDWFRFDSPELDWSTSFQLIPNLSDWGRIRATYDTSLKWEVISDFKWGIAFYSTFDNKPVGDAPSYDYGVNTTVSYDF